MKDTPNASSKCLAGLLACFDDRTGAKVQELLDSLYAKGYTQEQICDALKQVLASDA